MQTDKFTPKPTDKTYKLCNYTFSVFSIDGFSFDKSINISSAKGVYCFTTEFNKDIVGVERKKFQKAHSLIYLGKADGNDGINGRLLSTHEHYGKIKSAKATFLGIYECNKNDEAKEIETKILEKYDFAINEMENMVSSNKPTTVEEV